MIILCKTYPICYKFSYIYYFSSVLFCFWIMYYDNTVSTSMYIVNTSFILFIYMISLYDTFKFAMQKSIYLYLIYLRIISQNKYIWFFTFKHIVLVICNIVIVESWYKPFLGCNISFVFKKLESTPNKLVVWGFA